MSRKALLHDLFARPLDGPAIEALSFSVIDREAPPHAFTPEQWQVLRRMIHATADFSLMDSVHFSAGAVQAGVAALRAGRPLFVDSNMIRAGISLPRLQAACPAYDLADLHCHVADADTTRQAQQSGLPRSIFAARRARAVLQGGIALFGNAPAALLELNRLMIEENVRPALVIAAPVGFIHVEESKQELMELGRQQSVPFIVLAGRRGGSPIAVSMLHALCSLAAPSQKQIARPAPAIKKDFDTLILLGHGSRVPGAAQSMEKVAEALQNRDPSLRVAFCYMSRLGPRFEEVFTECVQKGGRRVLLLPYFLHEGLHIKVDIPAMLKKAAQAYPQVRLVMGNNLGFDPLLVELVQKRIRESRNLDDVRGLALADEASYPLPEGQPAFVAMRPEQAVEWKKKHEEKD